ncbi:DUF3421 domain containing protein, partial [Asbolus verrucosus]
MAACCPCDDENILDYYWRDYNGIIPKDALSGGKDANGKNVYIGQIYVHSYGLFIGTIIQGQAQIQFSAYKLRTTDSSSVVKILCSSHPDNFSWMLTTDKTLHADVTGKHAVVGGFNDEVKGQYYIGRVMYDRTSQVGPVISYFPGNAKFFFVHKNKHFVDITSYELLMYDQAGSRRRSHCNCGHCVDYYWRNYNGVVPKDALPGGKDNRGRNTYIGQVYMHENGLFICEIYPGIQQVEVQCYGVQKVDAGIKILCTQSKNSFMWLPTSAATFHVDSINRHVVVGGNNYRAKQNSGVLNIGRVMFDGALKVGAVTGHNVGAAVMYFAHKNKQQSTQVYETLVYNNLTSTIIMAVCCCEEIPDYYWRDFNGKIPKDALPGGKDVDGEDVYIGQIYVHDHGLLIGTIFQGKSEIKFPCSGVRKADSSNVVKILCTKYKDNFSWLTVHASTLHTDTIDKQVVVGGYNGKENGVYNIGRRYSWKDYYGVVPEDALPGGKDANGEDIYIGQAYVHEYGLFVCPLFRGQTKTEFPCYGIKTADSNIKILCANNEDDFRWLPTTSETLHVDTSNKQVVIGGFAAKVPDYYWRDYHGVVPEDAIPGGEDISGGHIYIGQVYMHDHGLFVAPIFPGKREVEFPCYGPKKANKVIKILCTHNKDNFSWLSTGATTLHLDTTGRHPVLGGYDGKTDGNNVIGLHILAIVCTLKVKSEEIDYYWKNYNGAVPADALPVGEDINGHHVYCGEAYASAHGLYFGAIFPGKKEVEYPSPVGALKTDRALKILCARNQHNFTWMRTSSATFHLDTINKHVVVGGFNNPYKATYGIGRIMLEGEVRIGVLDSFFRVGTTTFHFVYNHQQLWNVTTFEVLIYGDPRSDVYIKPKLQILCTQHKHKFRWLPTTSKTLHVDTAAKHAVVGGYNNLA